MKYKKKTRSNKAKLKINIKRIDERSKYGQRIHTLTLNKISLNANKVVRANKPREEEKKAIKMHKTHQIRQNEINV